MVGPPVFSRTISVARYMESKKNMPASSHSDTLGLGEVEALPQHNGVLFSTHGCPEDKRMGLSNVKNSIVQPGLLQMRFGTTGQNILLPAFIDSSSLTFHDKSILSFLFHKGKMHSVGILPHTIPKPSIHFTFYKLEYQVSSIPWRFLSALSTVDTQ